MTAPSIGHSALALSIVSTLFLQSLTWHGDPRDWQIPMATEIAAALVSPRALLPKPLLLLPTARHPHPAHAGALAAVRARKLAATIRLLFILSPRLENSPRHKCFTEPLWLKEARVAVCRKTTHRPSPPRRRILELSPEPLVSRRRHRLREGERGRVPLVGRARMRSRVYPRSPRLMRKGAQVVLGVELAPRVAVVARRRSPTRPRAFGWVSERGHGGCNSLRRRTDPRLTGRDSPARPC